ncbi:MAG: phosphate/phosphite/phosphonate ABC transporter substrate-binding protein, partial [Bacilli bacterium]
MKQKLKTSFAFIMCMLLLLVFFISGCGVGQSNGEANETDKKDEKPFLVGVIPAQNKGNMQEAMEKLEAELSKGLERAVKVNIYSDYNGVVEAMKYNKIDMAYYGPLTYVVVNHEVGAQAIITQTINGEPFYYSYIIAPKDSKLNSIEDLVTQAGTTTFAFGDINSTSG